MILITSTKFSTIIVNYNDQTSVEINKFDLTKKQTKQSSPRTINNKLLAQQTLLDYITGNFEAQERLANKIMQSDSTITKEKAFEIVHTFVRELSKSQKKNQCLGDRINLPTTTLKAFLADDMKIHGNNASI